MNKPRGLNIDFNNNDVSEFSFAQIYFKEIFWINLLLLLVLSFVLSLSFLKIILLTVILLFSSSLLLYLLGSKRRKGIEKISALIEAIKNNKQISVEEIKLDSHLANLENDLKKMFQKNQQDIANMKKLAQSRTDFLGNVSHELRTPIFTIQGFLETLLNGAIDDKKVNRRFLKKAMNHTINLDALLNDLIDISMIESGQMRMLPSYFNISEFIKVVVEEMDYMASEKGLKIETKFYDNEIQVFGDKDKIKQVLVNLISNAIKYSAQGVIVIETKEKNGKVEITIQDSGYGLSNSDVTRIFERFYRVDKARSKDAGGTGLGLAIVKHITEAHGSKIEVSSKLGKGSTFAFCLRKK